MLLHEHSYILHSEPIHRLGMQADRDLANYAYHNVLIGTKEASLYHAAIRTLRSLAELLFK